MSVKEGSDSNRGDLWADIGDAYEVGKSPHLEKDYSCPCSGNVTVEAVLRDMGTLVEGLTKCDKCGRLHVVLFPKKHFKRSEQ